MMNSGAYRVLTIALICLAGYAFGGDDHGCYTRQKQAIESYGPSAPLYYWFPKCLPGGYFQNVQCTLFACYCTYFDTGKAIRGTLENLLPQYMRVNCPLEPELPPDLCSMPHRHYPCKAKAVRYYYNPSSGECEISGSSCLGFQTKEACSTSCAYGQLNTSGNVTVNRCDYIGFVTKQDKCSFRRAEGEDCRNRLPSTRWHHNDETGACEPFTFNGCGGNSNNYDSKWMCLKSCEYANNTDLVVKVENHRYYINLPTWVVEQRGYRTDRVEELTVEQFKEIEIHLIEISKIESAISTEDTKEEYENYRPEHARKNMTRAELCRKPKAPGPCRALVDRWYFDETKSKCVKFGYGGCFGNENRHMSASNCAIFCDAKVKPSEAELFQEILFGLGGIGTGGLGGILPTPEEDNQPNTGERSLEVGRPAPKPSPVEEVGEAAVYEFSFDDDEETTTDVVPTGPPSSEVPDTATGTVSMSIP